MHGNGILDWASGLQAFQSVDLSTFFFYFPIGTQCLLQEPTCWIVA
uniref:Uncharacterized protein n=1 Tax=Arundo donax TaxID=35708 RepID=A0A0A9AX99_ARUDO